MSTPTRGWRPPAECPGCDRAVRRAVAVSNGGYCTTCRPRGASPVQALPPEERLDLTEWQRLARERGQAARQDAVQRSRRRRAR